jgi:predicted Ser/Thr protein kinase
MAAAIKIGTIFAGYRIEGVLGRGGMGVVYLAEQPELGRRVAIKVIAPALASDPDYLERFKRESRLAAAIEHPNAIPIYEAGVAEEDMPYLVMRYVEGEDLSSLLRREGRLETRRAAAIVDQIAGALDEAHARGLVHRDVKPANVIVESRRGTEHAYLTDFGLTREMDASSGVTATGRWVGTIDYASPEQIKGRPVDARCDVYALGCVLFTTLTGRLPFEREEDVAKIYAHVSEPPPAPSSLVEGVPKDVDRVIARAMAKDPDFRFPSAGDLGRAALAAATGVEVGEPEHTVATGEAAPATQPSPGAVPASTEPAALPPTASADQPATEPAGTIGAGQPPTGVPPTEPAEPPPAGPGQPRPARAEARRRRLAVLGAVLAVGAAVAVAVIALGGGGGNATSTRAQGSAPGGGGQNDGGRNRGGGNGSGSSTEVAGVKVVPFTQAGAFAVEVPKGSKPGVVDQELGGGVVLTALVTPDEKIDTEVQQASSDAASQLRSAEAARASEGATQFARGSRTVAGRKTYYLGYTHTESARHGLPDMGETAVYTSFFNEGAFSWRTRAAVSTSVADSANVAQALSTHMAETFQLK